MRVMAYLRPPLLTRKVFNAIAMRFGISGVQTLAVRRRKTGVEQTIPVIPVDHDGARYLVSPRCETEWVRNLRAARGEVELRSKQGSQRYRAAEVPVAERDAIIEAYRAKAGRTVAAYWKKLPDPADHPTFRLTPR